MTIAYVDLNPVRAGMTTTLIDSDFTSIQQRLVEIAREQRHNSPPPTTSSALLPFARTLRAADGSALPFNLQEYLDLIDIGGRVARRDKRGAIPEHTPRLLSALGLAPDEWFKTVSQLQARFELFIGAPHRLRHIAQQRGWCWVRGLAAGKRLYAKANP